MAFQQKEWKNRLSEHPTRRLLTPTDGSDAFEVDVTREEGTIMQQGDPFSAANMNDLEQRIAAGIGGGDENMAPIEEGPESENAYTVGQLLIYGGQLYRVISAIAIGNTLVEDVNIEATTLSNEFVGEMTANGNRLYMDYHDGKYGYNTSPTRGADTFTPFSYSVTMVITLSAAGGGSSPDFDGLFHGYCNGSFTFTESENLKLINYSVSGVGVTHTGNTWQFSVAANVYSQWHSSNANASGTVTLTLASI